MKGSFTGSTALTSHLAERPGRSPKLHRMGHARGPVLFRGVYFATSPLTSPTLIARHKPGGGARGGAHCQPVRSSSPIGLLALTRVISTLGAGGAFIALQFDVLKLTAGLLSATVAVNGLYLLAASVALAALPAVGLRTPACRRSAQTDAS